MVLIITLTHFSRLQEGKIKNKNKFEKKNNKKKQNKNQEKRNNGKQVSIVSYLQSLPKLIYLHKNTCCSISLEML